MSSLRYALSKFLRIRPMLIIRFGRKLNFYRSVHHSKLLMGSVEIKMPSLSPTMTEGTIVKWLKNEGDPVEAGDAVCEIQTDKAVVALEIEEEGILKKIIIPEDTKNVQLGVVIALLETEYDVSPTKEPATKIETIDSKVPEKQSEHSRRLLGPSVKKLLADYGIDITQVPISGPLHNILKGDVLNYIQTKGLNLKKAEMKKPQKTDDKIVKRAVGGDFPVSEILQLKAKQSVLSKTTIPHTYMEVDCYMNKLNQVCKSLNEKNRNISFGAILIKSVATGISKVPEINIVRSNNSVNYDSAINVSLTTFENSSVVCKEVLNAHKVSLDKITEILNSDKESTTHTTGNLFRISDFSQFGINSLTDILQQSEVAVLSVGSFRTTIDGQKVNVMLSFNSMLISEDVAGEFLTIVKDCLENPFALCLT